MVIQKNVPIRVSIGVLRNTLGQVLVAKKNQVECDSYEFPGGKLEPGENRSAALVRELWEELGVVVQIYSLLHKQNTVISGDPSVLYFYFVTHWQGEPYGKEGQLVRWVDRSQLNFLNFPVANSQVLTILALLDTKLSRFVCSLHRKKIHLDD